MGRLGQLVLAIVVALGPYVGHSVREGGSSFRLRSQFEPRRVPLPGGSLAQQYLEVDREDWQPPGIPQLAKFLKDQGHDGTSKVVEENGVAVAIAIVSSTLASLVLMCLLLWCCCRSRPTGPDADAAAGPGQQEQAAGAAAPASGSTAAPAAADGSEEAALPDQISKLKKEKTRMLLEQAMQKAKLERLMASILQLEAELQHQEHKLSPEEIERQAVEAIRATEMLTERSLLSAVAYVAPLAAQGARVYDTMEKRRAAVQLRATKVAFDEAQIFCKDLAEVFAIDEEVRNGLFSTLSHLEIPGIATIVSAAMAPAKLRVLLVTIQLSIAVHLFYIVIAAFVILTDRHLSCGSRPQEHSNLIYWWFSTDLAVCTMCLLIRAWSLYRVTRVVDNIEMPPVSTDEPVKAFRMLLDYYMTVGAEAMKKYDEFMESWVNAAMTWVIFFSIAWMIYAIWIVFNFPWANCITSGLIVLRVRVCFFLMALVPVVCNVLAFFLSRYLGGEGFQMWLLSAAAAVDQTLQVGIPVAGIIVQSLTVRNPRDLTVMSLRRAELQKYELSVQKREAEATLHQVEASTKDLEAKIDELTKKKQEEANMTDDELRLKHVNAKDAIVADAEMLFMKLTGKAEELTKSAELQVQKWEEEGGLSAKDLLDSGLSMAQVQEYMQAAREQAEESVGRIVQDESVQRAMAQIQENAQAAAEIAQERAKDLPSLEVIAEQSTAALGQAAEQGSAALGSVAAATKAPPAPAPAAMADARAPPAGASAPPEPPSTAPPPPEQGPAAG